MSRARTLFAIALVAAACGDPGSTATRNPRIDWFEYEGRDPVYAFGASP